MQIFVQGTSTHAVSVNSDTTVEEIKERICNIEQVAYEDLCFHYAGVPLEDDVMLNDALPNLATIVASGKLLGGKVHGSLARAGKVKGQTPKVAAMEDKKKKRTGRCKRRIQYNRRFSTAVSQFGRKKGPNSNSA
ncbi:ubiquitin-like FUBI-ribosomal protein eS30 fusion protein [Bolinopsis microptera]|uniref:ubiquitin-like FUBI-ribosomal protein eS30 fusion protein n=1 Tax=Bolinopsis microptera TaxID=2820187 RepID=UPI0030797FF5